MSRKIRKTGRYSGLRKAGLCPTCGGPAEPWPEVLVGVEEIAGYLRKHPETVGKWIREGRLPAPSDGKGRRWITKGLIDRWAIVTFVRGREKERAKRGVEREARREMIKDGGGPRPVEKLKREEEGRKGSLLRCGTEAWQACPENPNTKHSVECYPICPYCMASDERSHTEQCPATHRTLAN